MHTALLHFKCTSSYEELISYDHIVEKIVDKVEQTIEMPVIW